MSDEETAEQVDTADAASAADADTGSNPWGDDFDANTAWGLVTKLRGVEKELEPDARAYKRLSSGEDPDTFAKLAEAYGYELSGDEPEEDNSDWEDPNAAEFAALKKEQAEIKAYVEQRKVADAVEAFRSDLKSLSSEKGVDLTERQTKFILAQAVNDPKGLSPASTKAAFNDLIEELEAYEQGLISKHGIKPKAARKPIQGESASQVPDLKTSEDKADYIQRMVSDMAD